MTSLNSPPPTFSNTIPPHFSQVSPGYPLLPNQPVDEIIISPDDETALSKPGLPLELGQALKSLFGHFGPERVIGSDKYGFSRQNSLATSVHQGMLWSADGSNGAFALQAHRNSVMRGSRALSARIWGTRGLSNALI
ncbi:hypothetical protein CDAR_369111 [Caerostris darwini]|uniref:Uncharacterized protein n=1 Tax=Caerostris darwini TaxID=1538125 RepID=A0AAV4WL49_9ARAC|nr:hypothetical protein CDAR_369051 [Caerostris darwini]GIY82974.1 hypothetical protein CDAR_369111 [Caerostris darwini]